MPGDEGFERKHVSPPKRDDDREGHYVFNLGENLTPRCNFFAIAFFSFRFLSLFVYIMSFIYVYFLQFS